MSSDGKKTFVGSGGSDIPTPTEEKNLYEYEGAPLEPGTLIIGNGVARMRPIDKGDYMPFMAADGEIMNLKIVNTLASEIVLEGRYNFWHSTRWDKFATVLLGTTLPTGQFNGTRAITQGRNLISTAPAYSWVRIRQPLPEC